MPEDLISKLAAICSEGRKEAEKYISASRDAFFSVGQKVVSDNVTKNDPNLLMRGDNIAVMQYLLRGDKKNGMRSFAGKINLIYIDPPFYSRADYQRKDFIRRSGKKDGTSVSF